MDSGNHSGSLQSSSGDEEYDSRAADSISSFTPSFLNIINPPPVPPSASAAPPLSSSLFDPLSNFFDPISRTQNSLLNLDIPTTWSSKTLRSDHDVPSSSSPLQSFFTDPKLNAGISINQLPSSENNAAAAAAAASGTNTPRGTSDHHTVRTTNNSNPKKRSRASRRAPTTVLTTDTTNFRAMVQEFTGIPAPPFTATTSPFQRARFDLYGTPSSRSNNQQNPLENSSSQLPPYLRRPFPQKVQLPPPFLSSSINPPLSPQSSFFNIPNPNIFTSFLQSNVNNPEKIITSQQGCSSSLDINPNDHSRLKMSILDEFGLGHGTGPVNTAASSQLGGLPSLISSDQTGSRNNDPNNSQLDWPGNNGNNINGANGKINFSSSSSMSFQGDHNKESAATAATAATGTGGGRSAGEGMMESWICSSDLK
ncbi:hypothetical protein M9H77_19747 [Catharanthus roseus]|uniref:Uncharacterized protein n=1 Tax=Catharanthus roseus TaxID=4058 RepID=A0ACC0BBA4_CATRO|nr:hypothetical protein M9H77_19747 [Catharanthus roseus]